MFVFDFGKFSCFGVTPIVLFGLFFSGVGCSRHPAGSERAPMGSAASRGSSPPTLTSAQIAIAIPALQGRWRIVEYDGASVDAHGTPGSDPAKTAEYMAGSFVEFNGVIFRLVRGETTATQKQIASVKPLGPASFAIDIGYGESRFELLDSKSARRASPLSRGRIC